MVWKTVRLELGATEAFPRGSAGRAFLLHVPVTSDDLIDSAAIGKDPGRATVRRFWGSEPDSFGQVEIVDGSWAMRCSRGPGERSTFFLDPVPLRLDEEVMVRQPCGAQLPFRVASVRSTGQRS